MKSLTRKIDRDNPEWTDAEFQAKPAAELLPESVHAMLGIRRRGPQRHPPNRSSPSGYRLTW